MTKITVEVRELRDRGNGETVKDLLDFLKDKVGAGVKAAGDEIAVDDDFTPSKAYLRVLIRKFLHQAELKESFRVVSGKGNVFTIKERKEMREE